MADPSWPKADEKQLLGQRISRVDGPAKVTGAAKYAFDIKRPGMLYAKIVRCPHAHARIKKVDMSAAEKMKGVKAVRVIQGFTVASFSTCAPYPVRTSIVVAPNLCPHSISEILSPIMKQSAGSKASSFAANLRSPGWGLRHEQPCTGACVQV